MTNLQLEGVLEFLENELKTRNFENEDIVRIILVWENKPFNATNMRERLLKDNKEKNIETLLNNLKQRFDVYTVSYSNYLSLYKDKVVQLDEDLQTIVDNLFIDLDLTNLSTERERNREQVEQLTLDGGLRQECFEYIESNLVTLMEDEELEDDANIEELTIQIFTDVMLKMLYREEAHPNLHDIGNFLKNSNIIE